MATKIEPYEELSQGKGTDNLEEIVVFSKKVNKEKTWLKDLASDFDLCIVFPSKDDAGLDLEDKGIECMVKLRQHDFEVFAFVGNDEKKSIFVLIRATLDKLRAFADIHNFSMPLDASVAREKLEAGNSSRNIAPVILEHQPQITKLQPFENLYGEYSRLVDETLFLREAGKPDPFCRSIRLKLSVLILHSRPPGDGSFNSYTVLFLLL